MTRRAFCCIRDLPHYRRDAFVGGLSKVGFEVVFSGTPRAGDVVVIWNRYGQFDQIATAAEKAGAVVLCSENGFVGRDEQGNQLYQLAVGGHNGSGYWRVGSGDRLAELGIEVAPDWAPSSPEAPVVIRGQRGIGRPSMASPPDWHNLMAQRLRAITKRRIVVVPHPGASAVTDQKHVAYLAGAHALVVWSSSVGVKALVMGVPVISDAKYWVCKNASPILNMLESPLLRSSTANEVRLATLQRMAWAQWTLAELASGHPFRFLLEGYEQHLQAEGAVA